MKNKKIHYSKGITFGVFDGLHPGHEYFLKNAAKKCDQLIVVVASAKAVKLLKKHPPKYPFSDRISKIKKSYPNFIVTQGDSTLGKWSALKKYRPNMVFLGYDQQEIFRKLKKMNITCIFLKSYRSPKYKSSILR